MRILIAGCGDVGTALGLRLAQAGHAVWGLRRNPTRLPPALQPLAADLSDPATLCQLPNSLDAVYYTAAAENYTETAYKTAYVQGVNALLSILISAKQPLKRLFFISSTSVYGQQDGRWVDENAPAEAPGFAATSLRTGEQQVWASPYLATVVRLAGIYGPGRTRLIDNLRSGQARCTPGVYTNRIHRDDCAGVLAHLLTVTDPAALYIGVDDQPAAQCDVLRWLAQQLRVSAPVTTTIPTANKPDPTRRQATNKRCSNARLHASGYLLQYPGYRQGYAELLASHQQSNV